jgi:hypothetical protein
LTPLFRGTGVAGESGTPENPEGAGAAESVPNASQPGSTPVAFAYAQTTSIGGITLAF